VPAEFAPEPDSKPDPELPVEPVLPLDPMFGQGWPARGPEDPVGPRVAVGLDVAWGAEVGSWVVPGVAPGELGAAAAPAMPAIAPALASAPVTSAAVRTLGFFTSSNLLRVGLVGTPSILGVRCKEIARAA
jgi:hypothetical protein